MAEGTILATLGGVVCAMAVFVASGYPSNTGWLARGAGAVGALVAFAFLTREALLAWRKSRPASDSEAASAPLGQEVLTLLFLVAFPVLVLLTSFWLALATWPPIFLWLINGFSLRRLATIFVPLAGIVILAQNYLSLAIP